MRDKFFILPLVVVSLLGILHHVGSNFFLYWRFSWFDVLMHFLGGLAIGFIFVWLRYFSTLSNKMSLNRERIIPLTIVFVLLVGLGWEYFEYYFDIANPVHQSYVADTVLDLVADIFGGVLGGLVAKSYV